jgi:translation initiation factor 3 subunit B
MPALQTEASGAPEAMEDDFERKHHEMRSVAKDCLVVVDNLPEVDSDKFDKLCDKVFPRFEGAGKVARNPNDDTPRIFMAKDSNGHTLGYAFVEYVSPEEAHKAVVSLHGTALSKKHVFWVDTAGALERLQDVPEAFVPPSDLTVATRGRADYKSWLLDGRGRDMFMIRHDKETSIFWNDHIVKPSRVCAVATPPATCADCDG